MRPHRRGNQVCTHRPVHPAQSPNLILILRAPLDARDANDVPAIDRAKQRGFRRADATFGLKKAVGSAVSSPRNTNLSTICAAAASLGIFHKIGCAQRHCIHAQTKSLSVLRCAGFRQSEKRFRGQNRMPTSSITRSWSVLVPLRPNPGPGNPCDEKKDGPSALT